MQARNLRAVVAVLLAMLAIPPSEAAAQSREIYTGLISSVAVGGYDPVAYFSDGKPTEGRSDITWTWKGATWRFASVKNRDAFKATPEAYAPQYGGHCAWAVSEGYAAKGDPRHWKIVNGKLYLNYNAKVQSDWERNVPGHIAKADKNWPAVLGR